MYERFTDRARKVARLARDRAIESPDARDVLLAVLDEGSGVAVVLLHRLKIDTKTLRGYLESLPETDNPQESHTASPTKTFNRIVEHAIQEARELNHNYIGTEHLLLGIVGLGNHPVTRMLLQMGVTRSLIIDEVNRVLGRPSQKPPAAPYRFGRFVRNVIQKIAALWGGLTNRCTRAASLSGFSTSFPSFTIFGFSTFTRVGPPAR